MTEEPILVRTPDDDRVTMISLNLDGEDVSRLWLFHFDMRLRTATVTMGGIGGVGTNDDYRKRGLASRVMSDSVDYMAEHDQDIGMLFGIRDFYERWGYVTAMASHELRVNTAHLPADTPVEVVDYDPAIHRDAVLATYAAGNTSRSCAAVRGAHYWTDFEKGTDWDENADGKVLLGEDGVAIAYLNMVGDPERTRVAESGFTSPSALPAVTSYLARRASDAGHDRVTACCPPDDPLAIYLRHYGCEHRQWTSNSGGGMMRIIRLVPLFEKLTEYLTGRAATAGLRGWAGAIALRTDIGDVTLRVHDGAVAAAEGSESDADLIVEIPQDRLLQLLVGYRDATTIALDEGVVMSDDAARVLDAMFPPDTPYMWWSDRF